MEPSIMTAINSGEERFPSALTGFSGSKGRSTGFVQGTAVSGAATTN